MRRTPPRSLPEPKLKQFAALTIPLVRVDRIASPQARIQAHRHQAVLGLSEGVRFAVEDAGAGLRLAELYCDHAMPLRWRACGAANAP
jgi:hypothetical protein